MLVFGGAERDRTVGLDNANVALSQLSYSPGKKNHTSSVNRCRLTQLAPLINLEFSGHYSYLKSWHARLMGLPFLLSFRGFL